MAALGGGNMGGNSFKCLPSNYECLLARTTFDPWWQRQRKFGRPHLPLQALKLHATGASPCVRGEGRGADCFLALPRVAPGSNRPSSEGIGRRGTPDHRVQPGDALAYITRMAKVGSLADVTSLLAERPFIEALAAVVWSGMRSHKVRDTRFD